MLLLIYAVDEQLDKTIKSSSPCDRFALILKRSLTYLKSNSVVLNAYEIDLLTNEKKTLIHFLVKFNVFYFCQLPLGEPVKASQESFKTP